MSSVRRPLAVTVIGWLYIVIGGGTFLLQFPGLLRGAGDSGWVELVEALAILAGIFLLRGHNWARWLAVAWLAFHVAISYPAADKLAVHGAFLAVIAWFLFQPSAGRYFARGIVPADTDAGAAAP
ncbi:MAG: hypothetical protein ACRD17_07120 [Terriglobales bacterium]